MRLRSQFFPLQPPAIRLVDMVGVEDDMHDVRVAQMDTWDTTARFPSPVAPAHQICPVLIQDLNIVVSSFSPEAGEGDTDDLALCNLDGLGGVMVWGIR